MERVLLSYCKQLLRFIGLGDKPLMLFKCLKLPNSFVRTFNLISLLILFIPLVAHGYDKGVSVNHITSRLYMIFAVASNILIYIDLMRNKKSIQHAFHHMESILLKSKDT